jgi:DNA-binding Lrp family transcriptional regulator
VVTARWPRSTRSSSCGACSGLPDYFLRVAVRDLEAYEAVVTDRLGAASGLARIDSHLTIKKVT